MRHSIFIAALLLGAAPGAVLDRVAVTVGNDAITESEVLEEIRVTGFLNNERLDLSTEARRAAADRLVDQYLIRKELASGAVAPPDSSKVDEALRDFVKAHFHSQAEFEQKLKEYGITLDELKEHIAFQLAALQFTELRFADTTAPNVAERAAPGGGATDENAIDQRLDSWLKDLRAQTRIEFKKEAFE